MYEQIFFLSGLCELEFFGKIPVGGKEYNDTRCEEATCYKGYYIVTGWVTKSKLSWIEKKKFF